MENQSGINKKAWSYRAYEFWSHYNGVPGDAAKAMVRNPQDWVQAHLRHLGDIKGRRIANLLGSNGRKAVPLALLGAEVTIVDISEENEKYAKELAYEAGVNLRYIVSDLKDLDTNEWHEYFDIAFLEGGILHYFSDLHVYFKVIFDILNVGGRIVLNDSHPVRKILQMQDGKLVLDGNYFDTNLKRDNVAYKTQFPIEEQKDFPDCLLRHWTMGEIITSLASVGFVIDMLEEEPRWDSFKDIPGTYTITATKYDLTNA